MDLRSASAPRWSSATCRSPWRPAPGVCSGGVSSPGAPGELVGRLVPTGAGNTTTKQRLLGITRQTAAHIEILGLVLARERPRVLQQVNFSSAYVALPPRL